MGAAEVLIGAFASNARIVPAVGGSLPADPSDVASRRVCSWRRWARRPGPLGCRPSRRPGRSRSRRIRGSNCGGLTARVGHPPYRRDAVVAPRLVCCLGAAGRSAVSRWLWWRLGSLSANKRISFVSAWIPLAVPKFTQHRSAYHVPRLPLCGLHSTRFVTAAAPCAGSIRATGTMSNGVAGSRPTSEARLRVCHAAASRAPA